MISAKQQHSLCGLSKHFEINFSTGFFYQFTEILYEELFAGDCVKEKHLSKIHLDFMCVENTNIKKKKTVHSLVKRSCN